MLINGAEVGTSPRPIDQLDLRSAGTAGVEFANSTCRAVGLAIGADCVRFIEVDPVFGSPSLSGSWTDSIAPKPAVLRDPFPTGLERQSIDAGTYLSGTTLVDQPASPAKQSNPSNGSFSGFAVPVADDFGLLGAIGVYFNSTRSGDDRGAGFVESMARTLAESLRASRRVDLLSSESDTWRALAAIRKLASDAPEIKDAYDSVAEITRTLLEFDAMTIALVDSEEQTRQIDYAAGADLPESWTQASVKLAGSMDEQVVLSKESLRVGEHNRQTFADLYSEAAELDAAGWGSWLTVPLLWQGREVGLLSILSRRTDAYDDENLNLLDQIGDNLSGAVANARLRRRIHREVESRSIINELGRTVSSAVRISEMYPLFADGLKRLVPFDRITISLSHPTRGTVKKSYVAGAGVPGWHPGHNYPPGPLTELAIRVGHGVIRNAGGVYPEESANPYEDRATNNGLLSALAVPLTVHNRSVGTMCLRAFKRDAFDTRYLQLAERAGEQIAGSILAFQYQSALSEQIEETELLDRFFGEAVSAKSVDAILDRTFEATSEVLQFDRMVLGLITPGSTPRLQLHARGIEVPGDNVAGRLSFSNQDVDGWVRDGYLPPFFGPISDVPLLNADHGRRLADCGLTSWMHVPLATDQLLGYVAIQGRLQTGYIDRHLRKFDKFAYLLAQAINTVMPCGLNTFGNSLISDDADRSKVDGSIDLSAGPSNPKSLNSTRLLLIDGDPLCLARLSTIANSSNIELVGTTAWSDALAEMAAVLPDVVLVCAHDDDIDLSLIQHWANNKRLPPFLVILEDSESDEARRYLDAGASGIIVKAAPAHQIIAAIERVANEQSDLEPRAVDSNSPVDQVSDSLATNIRLEKLQSITDRDREILKGVASGQTNSEIAHDLNLAAGTVRNRLGDLYAILEVPDRGAAVYMSMRLGIIK